MGRKIIHIDLDCFYAQVEERDDPALRGKPIGVGGYHRGVLCTCNYLAREFGCHSGMPSTRALKQCPDLVLVPPNFEKYKRISQAIRQIYQDYTDRIEPLSLDEAYLDVTECSQNQGSATRIATAIRKRIWHEHQLTASAGISVNKFIAKVASDWRKPNGQFVVAPEAVDDFVAALPVAKIWGVGKVTAEKCQQYGMNRCADVQKQSLKTLTDWFGKFGVTLYQLSRGIDDREVSSARTRKSLSVERTFDTDVTPESCIEKMPALFEELDRRLAKVPCADLIEKQFVKIKFEDFKQTTVETGSRQLSCNLFLDLLHEGLHRVPRAVRLLGLGVRFQEKGDEQQLSLM